MVLCSNPTIPRITDFKKYLVYLGQICEYLPKPWERKELEFASDEKILKNESFAVEFFDKILGMDFYKGFFSDETYLEHFYCDVDDDKKERIKKGIIEKVKSYYGVDIRDVYDFALPDVFTFIDKNRII